MPDYPPFMNASGTITKVLARIKDAKTPERFTQDFLGTVLKCPGGSARPFIAFAKRIGLLSADGTPTDLYKRFRNPTESGAAIAACMKHGYGELYKRNEYAHKLDRKALRGLVKEVTGLEDASSTVKALVGSFEALKSLSDFDAAIPNVAGEHRDVDHEDVEASNKGDIRASFASSEAISKGRIGLGYTININLPNTDDPAVFNAIFQALKSNIL